jgi:hypothetical protein
MKWGKNTVQPGRPQMTIRSMRMEARWITRATHRHLDYVITFPRQQWLREPALMLRNTYISSLVSYRLVFTPEIWSILIISILRTVHLVLFRTMTNKCTIFHKLTHCYIHFIKNQLMHSFTFTLKKSKTCYKCSVKDVIIKTLHVSVTIPWPSSGVVPRS